jgi:S1-C subfamily serine protease
MSRPIPFHFCGGRGALRLGAALGAFFGLLGLPAVNPADPPKVPVVTVAPKEELLALEKRTIDIFKEVSQSVVTVGNRAVIRDRFNVRISEVPQGAGSGFVWDKEGHIISNFHVVREAGAIEIVLRDGKSYEAKVVGSDPDHDIAVLKIAAPAAALVPVKVGTSADLQVGQFVFAIGNPFGLDISLSSGVVSALGRSIMSLSRRPIFDVIQTDAAINPGNSGGPLLDSAGRLIGINTSIVSASGGYSGVGFAVPVDTVRRVVPQLIAFGKVQRPSLGIEILPEHYRKRLNVDGVAVVKVASGGAAEKAGLRGITTSDDGEMVLGDVIVEADGAAVKDTDDLMAVLDRHQVGELVKITCVREKQRRTIDIQLQKKN